MFFFVRSESTHLPTTYNTPAEIILIIVSDSGKEKGQACHTKILASFPLESVASHLNLDVQIEAHEQPDESECDAPLELPCTATLTND